MPPARFLGAVTVALALSVGSFATPAFGKATLHPALYRALHYRFIGPGSGRVSAVAGIPGNPFTYYLGAASGGIWKTTDGGIHWKPVFDHEPVQSIGALAIDPGRPEVIWAGTGETFYIRPTTSIGNGIYRSDNGGRTWRHLGLAQTGRIARIVIDPTNVRRVYVCATGSGFGPSKFRGVYRTTDNGRHWSRVLFVNPETGCSDIAIDPADPRILLAGMWQFHIYPWDLDSGGPGSGVYLSRNGGRSWTHLTGDGLPKGPLGKIAVAISASDPEIFYTLIQDGPPGLYRSTDAGAHWVLVSHNHSMEERPPYYTRFAIAPNNPDRLYFISTNFTTSRNGGRTLHFEHCGCGDNHDFWIDPTNPKRMIITDDEGASVTLDGWKRYQMIALPNAQIYHVYTDRAVPYNVYANRQDGYSYRIPSNTRTESPITPAFWTSVGGCESGFAIPDTRNNNIVWSGCYEGGLSRFNIRRGEGRTVSVFPLAGYGWPPKGVANRWDFVFPIALSPENPNTVYVGSQYVYETQDGGQSWRRISPDLTLNRKRDEGSSGGVTIDNLGAFNAMSLSIIAPSPLRAGMIWTGGYDGGVHLTLNGGHTWQNVTPRGLPPLGTVTSITPSHADPNRAYLSVSRNLLGDPRPYIYVTEDDGRAWHLITHGIPTSVFSYVHCVTEDPRDPNLLFAGTENALYWSPNRGHDWYPLQNNLPHAPVYWVTVQPVAHDLVVATYGRGIYILSDLNSLAALSHAVRAGHATLFPLRTAYRFHHVAGPRFAPDYAANGHNPPYGAVIDFYLPHPSQSPVRLIIRKAGGKIIRVFSSLPGTPRANRLPSLHRGINRFVWDLRYAPVHGVSECAGSGSCTGKLRLPPPQAHWVTPGPKGYRHIVSWDLDLTLRGPLAVPGRDAVTLEIGHRHWTRPLLVLKDPDSSGTLADIRAQVAFALKIRSKINATVHLIDEIEWMRKTTAGIETRLVADRDHPKTLSRARHLGEVLLGVEGQLVDVYLTGAREDAFRHPMQIYGRLSALLKDVEDSADYPPTDSDRAVFRILVRDLRSVEARFSTVQTRDVTPFNRKLESRGLLGVVPVGHAD
ncbi:MAG: WD40/YVTN/BNR-like repeat-containing protein [Gammaproteobacteria bacterium]